MAVKEEDLFLDDRPLNEDCTSPVCTSCARLLNPITHTCEPFVTIPKEIWTGKIKHKKSYKGDGGLTYKKITQEELDRQIKEANSLLT